MNRRKFLIGSTLAAGAVSLSARSAWSQGALVNLGMIKLASNYNPGGYLQGTTGNDAWVHASNQHVNEEETWFLYQINQANHTYALMDWRTGHFLSRHGGGRTNHRVQANASGIGPSETWTVFKGDNYGRPGSLAFQATDQSWLCARQPGTNAAGENGEVFAENDNGVHSGPGWPGWWFTSPTGTPSPGKDPWNTVGGYFAGILNNVKPADVAALIAALA